MPYRGRRKYKKGVDLEARTALIEQWARAGYYHKDIAAALGVSPSTVEITMRVLRARGVSLPSMRGPRAAVVHGVD